MSLPVPNTNETRDAFIARCMNDTEVKGLPHDEGLALTFRQWNSSKNEAKMNVPGNRSIKVYAADDLEVNEGKREVVSIINTSAIDRDGEVVQPKGMRKKDFQGNPVVFANHSYIFDPKALPIGTCRWVKSSTDNKGNDVIVAKTYISDKTQEARDVFGLLQDGVLKSFSVGYETLKASKPTTQEINIRPELKSCKSMIRDWNMLEYSVVGIPCNPEALTLAVSKGCYSQKMLDIISGKAKNTAEATAEVIDAVQQTPELKKHTRSEQEVKALIAAQLDRITKAVDYDQIMQTAMKKILK